MNSCLKSSLFNNDNNENDNNNDNREKVCAFVSTICLYFTPYKIEFLIWLLGIWINVPSDHDGTVSERWPFAVIQMLLRLGATNYYGTFSGSWVLAIIQMPKAPNARHWSHKSLEPKLATGFAWNKILFFFSCLLT